MSLQAKYQSVLNLGEAISAQIAPVKEENGQLIISGLVHTQYDKNLMWDKIKEVGGDAPADLIADFQVQTNDYYALYVVGKDDTLGKIAKHFYEEPKKYTQIFAANMDVLSHPDKIEVGQILKIPFEV